MQARSDVWLDRLLISNIGVLNLLNIPLRNVPSLLQIGLNREVLLLVVVLLLNRNILKLGLGLWLGLWLGIDQTTQIILLNIPPSWILLVIPLGWGEF